MGDAGVETRLYDRVCARGLGLGTRARKEVDEWRHDDGQRHSGETLVENTGVTRAEHGRSQILCCRHGSDRRLRNATDDDTLGLSVRVRVWTNSNAAKAIAARRGLGKTADMLN